MPADHDGVVAQDDENIVFCPCLSVANKVFSWQARMTATHLFPAIKDDV
ncbi:MAG: hypothetical protein MUF15_08290 [Acidobacteria bacterium]|nr:hypothetical protein [Acidobacteriota bacterium]